MNVNPVVRYMILCEDWSPSETNQQRLNITGLLTNIASFEVPPYPLLLREFCVLLVLAGGRGSGKAQIICEFEDTGEKIFATRKRTITFPTNPLEVIGFPIRIRDCSFPTSGLYSVQFWCNNAKLEERPLLLR